MLGPDVDKNVLTCCCCCWWCGLFYGDGSSFIRYSLCKCRHVWPSLGLFFEENQDRHKKGSEQLLCLRLARTIVTSPTNAHHNVRRREIAPVTVGADDWDDSRLLSNLGIDCAPSILLSPFSALVEALRPTIDVRLVLLRSRTPEGRKNLRKPRKRHTKHSIGHMCGRRRAHH